MLFGGYEHWMLRFWTLRKLDATLLDALIATRVRRHSRMRPACEAGVAGDSVRRAPSGGLRELQHFVAHRRTYNTIGSTCDP